LRAWYAEGLIDPDFVLNLQTAQSQEPFQRNKVGYLGNVNIGVDLNLARPDSLYAKLRQNHPDAELVPDAPIDGFDGRPHIRTWGAAAHILQFSKALEREPEKVVRVLRMLDTLVAEPDLALEQVMGKRGLHWDYDDAKGVVMIPPYDQKAGGAELVGPRRYESIGFFMVSGLPLETIRGLRTPDEQALLERYARPEWGLTNVLGKTDVLSSASDALADLRILQLKFYTEIIRGDRPLADFDRFVQLWRTRGGDDILAEARQFIHERQRIYSLMGVSPPDAP
jgi:putative aldouronate transport system substrate-binding protein